MRSTSILLAATLLASATAQTSPRLKVTLQELHGQAQTTLKSGDVVDTGSVLEVDLTLAGDSSPFSADIAHLKAINDSLVSSLANLQAALQASQGKPIDAKTLATAIAPLNTILSQEFGSTSPPTPGFLQLTRDYSAWSSIHKSARLVDRDIELMNLLVPYLSALQTQASQQTVKAKLNFTQTSHMRQGRSFATSPFDLLTLSQSDQTLLNGLNSSNLQAKTKQIIDGEISTLKSDISKNIDQPLADLEGDLDTAKTVKADLQSLLDTLKQIQNLSATDLSSLIQNASQIFANANTTIDKIGTELAGESDSLKTHFQALAQAVKKSLPLVSSDAQDLANALTSAQSASVTLQQSVSFLIGKAAPGLTRVGNQSNTALPVQINTPFSNEDDLRFEVISYGPDGSDASAQREANLTVHAYKLGLNWERTIAFAAFPLEGSTTYRTSASVNLFAKEYTRNLGYNQFWAPGVGIAWFPVGVQQSNATSSGGLQNALGVVVSLFDDWVSVGYARNFTSNTYFPFVGIQVPFKL